MDKVSIAVDGPAGSGKSTIAKQIAALKNLLYIDTGAMYRAVTLKLLDNDIPLDNQDMIKKILERTKIEFVKCSIFLDGVKVDDEIRRPEINSNVSRVAELFIVRETLVKLQRKIAEKSNVVMDGRDIGTRVLPDAKFKFFLTASIEERAERRYEELRKKGYETSYDEVVKEIMRRDKIDSEREIDPLRKAKDAVLVDTTGKTINEVIDIIIKKMK